MNRILYSFGIIPLLLILNVSILFSQEYKAPELQKLVQEFKKDIRGPYKDIRWFCTDGSIRQPKDPCPDNIGPGNQHARYKDVVNEIARKNGIYFGQILTNTQPSDIWNPGNNFSRLKQYQLDRYLRSIDNGWINTKGQYYRGAIQAEDETEWGISFFTGLLAVDENVEKHFFILRNAMRDIPYKEDENLGRIMRSESKVISDQYPSFMDLRVKIHSRPQLSDIVDVERFLDRNRGQLTPGLQNQFKSLIKTMQEFFAPTDLKVLLKDMPVLRHQDLNTALLELGSEDFSNRQAELIRESSEAMWLIRQGIIMEKDNQLRLRLMDLSLQLEEIIFKAEADWNPENVKEQLQKICSLTLASAAAGYMEIWEWEQLAPALTNIEGKSLPLEQLTNTLGRARSAVEWSTSMFKAHFDEVASLYNAFEPMANGFIDDKIRASLVLHLGKAVSDLGSFVSKESDLTNKVMDLGNLSSIRGLNPGYALGELEVIETYREELEVSSNKIYIFQKPPSDLKPVAGIATVAEGNLVSHVQLLARNLGIPNAALSDNDLKELKKFNGMRVFYAVSNKGTVLMKPEREMTSEEKALFTKKERDLQKIEVPVKDIRLDVVNVLNMRDVDASNSGKLCGPKAANLGQLKKMFPGDVVEGLVIPFGIFREHMDQKLPGYERSYWQFLRTMFVTADSMRSSGKSEAEVEQFQLEQLELLRNAIREMPLKSSFIEELESQFSSVFGKTLGEIPVFLRSDTNMEDLKDFTGAGLNLTIFNTLDRKKLLQGIKDVWASPYSERSFKWRQKYLLNPENVFPSILVIPSVDVDYSGVMITKGINVGTKDDLTVAFSRGAGGAVDGQAAETHLITQKGSQLLAPAREVYYNRLPTGGGTSRETATFEEPMLSNANIGKLREFAASLRETLPRELKSDYDGAYDVELGFKNNKLWLFQIRPFVENKKALGSSYLESITPKIQKNKIIQLSTKL
ncbi:PEP/pyruvate-binding domain-containing protein [Muriicola soli]|uniref:Phosphoenolpyruvate synthase n=1 Tax=Muriicola soli TaxID=2507538 RepID=A0A411E7I9_9FLAO|nr:PEP/pyruvate-binding domain-containing protein [Muriicola soli]QBA63649.1 phosphoenolpyruvate synthase [Muriicola soli]